MIITSTGFKPDEGWLGNKFFKYLTLISASLEKKCELHLDPWMGDAFFHLERNKKTPSKIDIQISEGRDPNTLNTYLHNYSYILNFLRNENITGKTIDIAYNSNTFYHTSYYNNFKEIILDQFKFVKEISDILDKEIEDFKKYNNIENIFVCNLRIGDDYSKKWKFPELEFINFLNNRKDKEKIVVCTDSKEKAKVMLKDFDIVFFEPKNSPDVKNLLKKAGIDIEKPEYGGNFSFLPDYYIMTKADALFCSDSTFAYSAAMLNKNENCKFFKYNIGNKKINRFNPWSTWIVDMRTFRFNNLDEKTI